MTRPCFENRESDIENHSTTTHHHHHHYYVLRTTKLILRIPRTYVLTYVRTTTIAHAAATRTCTTHCYDYVFCFSRQRNILKGTQNHCTQSTACSGAAGRLHNTIVFEVHIASTQRGGDTTPLYSTYSWLRRSGEGDPNTTVPEVQLASAQLGKGDPAPM